MNRIVAALLLLSTLCLLAGCERTVRSMYDQPRNDAATQSALFHDVNATRPPPQGSVARSLGDPAADTSGVRGTAELAQRDGANAAMSPPQPITQALLLRGQERYGIYCMPCHSPTGDGDGSIVRHGFPQPPSLDLPRLRAAQDRHFFDVITQGYGIMVPFADRLTPEDRWAVVAYIRALQLSQHADVGALPADVQSRLRAMPAVAASPAASGAG